MSEPAPAKPRAKKSAAASDGLRIEYMPIAELKRFPGNPKAHDDEAILGSVERFGFLDPIAIDERTGFMSEGHGRLTALEAMRAKGDPPPEHVRVGEGDWLIPVLRGASFKSKAELERYIVAHNQTTIAGGWGDGKLLAGILKRAESANVPAHAMGFTSDAIREILVRGHTRHLGADEGDPDAPTQPPPATLADRFGVPPFSVLDARQGYWQDRKRQWLALGIESELGRGAAPGGGADAVGSGAAERERESRQLQESRAARRVQAQAPAGRRARP